MSLPYWCICMQRRGFCGSERTLDWSIAPVSWWSRLWALRLSSCLFLPCTDKRTVWAVWAVCSTVALHTATTNSFDLYSLACYRINRSWLVAVACGEPATSTDLVYLLMSGYITGLVLQIYSFWHLQRHDMSLSGDYVLPYKPSCQLVVKCSGNKGTRFYAIC